MNQKFVQATFRYFRVDKNRISDDHDRLQAKIILGFLVFYGICWISYVGIYLLLNNPLASLACACLGLPCVVIGLITMRAGKSPYWAAISGNFGGAAVLTINILFTGGSYSPLYAWFFFVTITTFLLNGRKGGWAIALMTSTVSLAMVGGEILSANYPYQFNFNISSPEFQAFVGVSYAFAIFSLACVTTIYEILQKKAFKDIKKAESKIQDQYHTIANLLDNMKQSVFVINEDLKVVPPVSKHSQEIFGLSIEQQSIFDILYKNIDKNSEMYSKIATIFTSVFDSGDIQWEASAPLLPTDIEYNQLKLKVTYSPIYNNDDVVGQIMFIVEDITELVEIEEKLKAEKRSNIRTTTALEAIVNVGLDKTYSYLNNSSLKLASIEHKVMHSPLEEETWTCVLRDLHTIKGNSRQLGFKQISGMVHIVEQDLIELKKKSKNLLPQETIDRLFQIWMKGIDGLLVYSDIVSSYFGRSNVIASFLFTSVERQILGCEKLKESIDDEQLLKHLTHLRYYLPLLLQYCDHPKTLQVEDIKIEDINSKYWQEIKTWVYDQRIHHQQDNLKLHQQSYVNVYRNSLDKLKKAISTNTPHDKLTSLMLRIEEVPLGEQLQDFKATVEELSNRFNKEISLKISEHDSTISRDLVSPLNDIMNHLIRNSIDHGIETPEVRIKKGKREKGELSIEWSETDDTMTFQVKDDGCGLDTNKLVQVAQERGLINRDSNLSEEEIATLVFEPSLSTASTVTDISGRGYGMNAVKVAVEELGGNISLKSTYGIGTTITLSIPKNRARTSHVMLRSS